MREFREWYKKSKGINVYTYNHDWNGFNIPSNFLKPFFNGLFDPLSTKEQMLLDLFKNKKDNFYIIGTWNDEDDPDSHVLSHEIAHAFWYLSTTYRKEAQSIISGIDYDMYNRIKSVLQDYGYANHVIADEMHAYISTAEHGKDKIFDSADIMLADVSDTANKLRDLFNQEYGNDHLRHIQI
jgi:hypothetical protein